MGAGKSIPCKIDFRVQMLGFHFLGIYFVGAVKTNKMWYILFWGLVQGEARRILFVIASLATNFNARIKKSFLQNFLILGHIENLFQCAKAEAIYSRHLRYNPQSGHYRTKSHYNLVEEDVANDVDVTRMVEVVVVRRAEPPETAVLPTKTKIIRSCR